MAVAERSQVVALPVHSEDPFECLVRDKSQALLNVAYRIVLSEEEARDVVQDAFLSIYRRYQLGKIDLSKLRTYAYQSVVNACIDRTRRRRPVVSLDSPMFEDSEESMLEQLPAAGADPRRETLAATDMTVLVGALERLAPRERGIFCLREIDGLAYEEIGEIMNMRPGTVRTSMLRARQHLQRILARYYRDMVET